jgi:hypothetical protein
VATRPVLRIFITSTAVDLRDYREKVRDAVLRLEGLPIAMETFSAQSGQPASECIGMAAEADAVVCILAHRYGYVPPRELGGDGERSITWQEVDAAKRAGMQLDRHQHECPHCPFLFFYRERKIGVFRKVWRNTCVHLGLERFVCVYCGDPRSGPRSVLRVQN